MRRLESLDKEEYVLESDHKITDIRTERAPIVRVYEPLKQGSLLELGAFPFVDDGKNSSDPILWVTAHVEGDRALIMSRYLLTGRRYKTLLRAVTWEESALRRWLNQQFYEMGFTSEERSVITSTWMETDTNPVNQTDGGNDTEDTLFLLSISEIQSYLGANAALCGAKGTPYALAKIDWTGYTGNAFYWLRTPGYKGDRTTYINTNGGIDMKGAPVDEIYGVRPAMWISVSRLYELAGVSFGSAAAEASAPDSGAASEAQAAASDGLTIRGGVLAECGSDADTIEIPDSVREIGDYAFYCSPYLKEVLIPASVKTIGAHVFDSCDRLKYITAPHLPAEAFGAAVIPALYGYARASVRGEIAVSESEADGTAGEAGGTALQDTIRESYRSWLSPRRKAFYADALQDGWLFRWMLKENILRIEDIDELRESVEDAGNPELSAMFLRYIRQHFSEDDFDRLLMSEFMRDPYAAAELKKTWKYSKLSDTTAEITGFKAAENDVLIPDHAGKLSIVRIGDEAFADTDKNRRYLRNYSNIRRIDIPDGITEIGACAFTGCKKLTELSLPGGLCTIGRDAFKGCRMLHHVSFGDEETYETLKANGSLKDILENAHDLMIGDRLVKLRKRVGEDRIEVGDIILMGTWPYDYDGTERDLEWIAAGVDAKGQMILISRYVIDAGVYNYDYIDISYEKCSLKHWLEKTFYEPAFTAEEKQLINEKPQLLGYNDANLVLLRKEVQASLPTPYAETRAEGMQTGGADASWWLKSPIDNSKDAMRVVSGAINCYSNYTIDEADGIRPAIRIGSEIAEAGA